MSAKTAVQALAVAMLKHALFEDDRASADTVWSAQRAEVRDHWRQRAAGAIKTLASDGFEIRKLP